MTRLSAHPLLDTPAILAHPENDPARVALDDPATKVMTDLLHRPAVTIKGGETIAFAEKLMASAGIRLLLVVNGGERLEGLLTYRDLRGERAMRAAAESKVSHDDLPVSQIMTPAGEIETISFSAVQRAHVRDLVQLMREHGRQHALVTEHAADGPAIIVRGIFSITQIGRQLGLDITASGRAQSFAEIEQLIAAG